MSTDLVSTDPVGTDLRRTPRSGAPVRWPRWRGDRLSLTAAAVALALCAVLPLVSAELHRDWTNNFLDLDVYRSAVLSLGSGTDVYSQTFSWAHLPFTYPPFALIALSWLRLLGFRAAGVVAMLGSLTVLAVVCAVLVRSALSAAVRIAHPGLTAVLSIGLTALAVELEPVRATIQFGQINLVLMALVVIDAFVIPVRYRGILSGLATAVKLTPAIFLIYHLCTGGWRVALRQAGTAAVVTAATAAVLPGESWRYWTSLVFTNRAGSTVYASNQNWTGLIDRFIGGGSAATVAIGILDLVTVVVAVAGVRSLAGDRHRVTALGITGLAGLLISPISWSHHWVWAVVLVAGLGLENPFRNARAAAVGLAALFYLGPQWRVPYGYGVERHWNWWQTIAGNGYTLAAALLLAVVALRTIPRPEQGLPPCDCGGRHTCPYGA